MTSKSVHVAVAVIVDSDNNILITRRDSAAHQGGLWEFPGGKVEAGESVVAALSRELREELGITPLRTTPLLKVPHDYGDKSVLLDVHVVWQFSGTASGLENQPLAWVPADNLQSYSFPQANLPILRAVQSLL